MTIETKFNVGEWVYTLEDDKIVKEQIIVIKTWCNDLKNTIGYLFSGDRIGGDGWREEEKVFASKEELLKSL